jgi:hypothetical protein
MDERAKRREARRRRHGRHYRTVDLGNGMEQAAPEAVFHAMASLPPDLGWASLAPGVIPILPRRRPMPPASSEPVRVTLPPGIPTGFGIDIGPAFLVVGSSLLDSWPIGRAELVATALSNLRQRLRRVRPRDLVCEAIDGVPVRVLQSGTGCASALVLIPDELARIFGPEPQVLVAPMRDLLISMPAATDRSFTGWLNAEFSAMDPNGLDLDAFALDGDALRYESLRTGWSVA